MYIKDLNNQGPTCTLQSKADRFAGIQNCVVFGPCQKLIKHYVHKHSQQHVQTQSIKNPVRSTCSPTNIVACFTSVDHLARIFQSAWSVFVWGIACI